VRETIVSKKSKRIKVAGIGDLHVGERTAGSARDLFAEVSEEADVLALCGDLTNLGTIREAEIFAQEMQACRIPVVGVLGNHDHESGHPDQVARILCDGGLKLLGDEVFECDGVGFAGVKGFAGGFDNRMLGAFGEDAIKRFVHEVEEEARHLEAALKRFDTDRIVVVLHYSPIAATLAGEPKEIQPFLGCSRLAETIDRFPVKAVLHGHAHHGTYCGKTARGIPVYNCAEGVPKESGKPYALIEV
jgi:Icc-related predicted phosphoesterase